MSVKFRLKPSTFLNHFVQNSKIAIETVCHLVVKLSFFLNVLKISPINYTLAGPDLSIGDKGAHHLGARTIKNKKLLT